MYAVVAAAALATAVLSLRNGFVYDDVSVIQKDTRIHSLDSLRGLVRAGYWTRDVRDKVYRPLTSISFAIDWRLGGGSPLPFHLGNIVLHVIVSLLVLALGYAALGRGAEIAALWFAVQPVHVEAVANAVGRAELLAAACYLAAVLLYRRDGRLAAEAPRGGGRIAASLGTMLFALLAVFAKEHALTLPAALLLMDWWEARNSARSVGETWKRHALLWIAVLMIAVGYLAARSSAVGTIGAGSVAPGLENLSLWKRSLVMLPAALVWARLFLFPLRLSPDYSPDAFVAHTSLAPIHFLALLILLPVSVAAWKLRRRAPAFGFGLWWIVVTGSVAANVVVPTGVTIAERVLYLPSVGAAIALGALWALLPRTRTMWVVTVWALLMLGIRSIIRIPVWSDQAHFYRALLHDAPRSYRSHWAQAALAFDSGSIVEGEMKYREAIRIYPDAAVIQELGERYLTAQLFPPADRYLTIAWRIDPLRSDAALEAVVARFKEGQPDSAARLGNEALRSFPDLTTLLLATSDAELARGNPVAGLTLRRRAAYLRPGIWQYQQVAAAAAAHAGLCDEARRRVTRAAELAPNEPAPRALFAGLNRGSACRPRP
jgi:tetratricopeptide (TPR) repeat protein